MADSIPDPLPAPGYHSQPGFPAVGKGTGATYPRSGGYSAREGAATALDAALAAAADGDRAVMSQVYDLTAVTVIRLLQALVIGDTAAKAAMKVASEVAGWDEVRGTTPAADLKSVPELVQEAVVRTYTEVWRQAPRSTGGLSAGTWVLVLAAQCARPR